MLILRWQLHIPISTKTNSREDLKAIMNNSEKAAALYKEFPGRYPIMLMLSPEITLPVIC